VNYLSFDRNEIISECQSTVFDIVVIGGGITGAGVARDAAIRGLKVALFEKNDFASGTSSTTSKMLHGGLRYLQNYEFRLVRKAALERGLHLKLAPHLTDKLNFIIPIYRWNKFSPIKMWFGVKLYDLLAYPKGLGKSRKLKVKDIIHKFPHLSSNDLIGGVFYHDVRTDDARITLSNILSARQYGASTLNYTKLNSWDVKDGITTCSVENMETNQVMQVKTKIIINCTGPWTESTEKLNAQIKGKSKLRLTSGIHLRLPKLLDNYSCLIINEDERPIFYMPGLNGDLIGTTDEDYQGSPDDVIPTKKEVDYLLDAVNRLMKRQYTYEDIESIFTGVRPLVYQDTTSEGKVSRDHTIHTYDNYLITILGGKLTTYRFMAKQAVDKAINFIQTSKIKCSTDKIHLYGGEIDDWDAYVRLHLSRLKKLYGFNENISMMLIKWYGSNLLDFEEVLKEVGTHPLRIEIPWLAAQVNFACRFEFARSPIDILRRRTQIMLEKGKGIELVERIVEIMSEELNWDLKTANKMIQQTMEYIESKASFR